MSILTLSLVTLILATLLAFLVTRFLYISLIATCFWFEQVEDVTTNKEVQAVGKYSVEEYNRLKGNKDNEGQLMFVKVVEAEKQVVSGMKYYLTIEAVNKTSGEVEVFEVVVIVKAWLR